MWLYFKCWRYNYHKSGHTHKESDVFQVLTSIYHFSSQRFYNISTMQAVKYRLYISVHNNVVNNIEHYVMLATVAFFINISNTLPAVQRATQATSSRCWNRFCMQIIYLSLKLLFFIKDNHYIHMSVNIVYVTYCFILYCISQLLFNRFI